MRGTITIENVEMKRIRAFKMLYYGKMLTVLWMEKISTAEVFVRVDEKRELWKYIQ